VLGPPRPYFRAMTIGWLGLTWFRNGAAGRSRRLILTTVMTVWLMFLPELLQASGTATMLHPILRQTENIGDVSLLEYEANFIVDNMGCEACESNVKNILEAHVRDAIVNWQTGLVRVRSDKEIMLDVLSQRLEYHGYSLHDDLNHFTKHMESNGEPQWFH
jgi:hypothetical protein